MVTEDYVSFETAKLLKEKGFDIPCDNYYDSSGKTPNESVYGGAYIETLDYNADPFVNSGFPKFKTFSAPTQAMAMKWFREVHNILLVVDYEYECNTTPYYFKIYRLGENGKPERVTIRGVSYDKDNNATEHIVGYRDWERSKGDYSTYEQACKAAIMYCLEKMI